MIIVRSCINLIGMSNLGLQKDSYFKQERVLREGN